MKKILDILHIEEIDILNLTYEEYQKYHLFCYSLDNFRDNIKTMYLTTNEILLELKDESFLRLPIELVPEIIVLKAKKTFRNKTINKILKK